MTCGQCGAPLARLDIRFCTRCGAPVGQAPAGQPAPGQAPSPYGQQSQGPVQSPYGQPSYGQPPYGQPPYGAPQQPPSGPEPSSSSLGPILGIAAIILVILGGVAYWAMSEMDDPPLGVGRAATSTPPPTSTAAPTSTRAPGIGINVPGPQGTPTTITLPNLPIPGVGGSPAAIPGARGTPPPSAKLTAEQAREKVKESISNCRVLQGQVELSQVTFEPPNWTVRLPVTGSTWTVNDDTGEVTADERATERARICRL